MTGELPGRVLALDIGSVRVGAAISDPSRRIAQGLDVWPVLEKKRGQQGQKQEGWRRKFELALEQYHPTLILVGMPTRTDGSRGPEGEKIAHLIEKLRGFYPELSFETWDERFTTVIANDVLISGGVSRGGRREHVDKLAAVLILQSWLDNQASAHK